MAKFIVHGQAFLDTICQALGQEPSMVRRLILDLKVGNVGMAYVELFADDEKLGAIRLDAGVTIEGVEEVSPA